MGEVPGFSEIRRFNPVCPGKECAHIQEARLDPTCLGVEGSLPDGDEPNDKNEKLSCQQPTGRVACRCQKLIRVTMPRPHSSEGEQEDCLSVEV